MQQIYFQWSLIWFLRIMCAQLAHQAWLFKSWIMPTCLINLYLVESVKGFGITYPLDSNLSVD